MARVAFICPAFFSHMRAFEALGESLRHMGHEITFLLPTGASAMVRMPGFAIAEIPSAEGYEPETVIARAARPRGIFGILRTVADGAITTETICRYGPDVLRDHGIEAVVGDELEPAGGLVARHLGLPFVSLAAALPIERDPNMPLPFVDWRYDPGEFGRKRNRGGEFVGGLLLTRQRQAIRRSARILGLSGIGTDVDCLSDRLRITQTVASFDFPRPVETLLRPVGPIRSRELSTGHALPLHTKRRRPFVFASLGTLQGHRFELFRRIADACRDLGADLLIAHCGGLDAERSGRLNASSVVDFTDQMVALEQADVCITHGGLNTVLDCIRAGTPMLALPIAFDQPGVGARIVHHRIGESFSARRATTAGIRCRLQRLLTGLDTYVSAGVPLRSDILRSGGAEDAAVLVDGFLRGGLRTSSPRESLEDGRRVDQTTHRAVRRRETC